MNLSKFCRFHNQYDFPQWKCQCFGCSYAPAASTRYNRACHPGGHYWNYCPGPLHQVAVTHLKVAHPWFSSACPWSANDFYRLDYMGQVTKVRLSWYLVLLSNDSKTRWQDRRTFVTWYTWQGTSILDPAISARWHVGRDPSMVNKHR